MMRKPTRAVALLAAVACVAGCSSSGFDGVYSLPLPGGADLGDRPYRVTVQFHDVLDLVPQSAVKVNDVAVGRVEKIDLAADGWTVDVKVAVNGSVRLPGNAVGRLRQSSLLGEKYVELAKPPASQSGAQPAGVPDPGTLADGAVIPLTRTNRNPEVEEVFGALSLLLNGGGIAQLQNIAKELNAALEGNEPRLRSLLSSVDTLVSTLDGQKGKITAALDGLNRLSSTLDGRREQLGNAIDNLGPGFEAFHQQRESLVGLLKSFTKLSDVAVDTIKASQNDLVGSLRSLAPVLQKLAEAGQNLPQALEILLTYPFPDAALGAIKGDYLNTYLTLTVDKSAIPKIDAKGAVTFPLPSADTGPAAKGGGR